MQIQEEQYLKKIKDSFEKEVDKKFRRGVAEHGGKLWLKENLINEAMNEVVDLYTYLYALKDQIKKGKMGQLKDNDSVDNFIKLPENEVVNKLSTNLACPYCNKPITDKDLKHFKCIKCKKSFKVNFNENI